MNEKLDTLLRRSVFVAFTFACATAMAAPLDDEKLFNAIGLAAQVLTPVPEEIIATTPFNRLDCATAPHEADTIFCKPGKRWNFRNKVQLRIKKFPVAGGGKNLVSNVEISFQRPILIQKNVIRAAFATWTIDLANHSLECSGFGKWDIEERTTRVSIYQGEKNICPDASEKSTFDKIIISASWRE